MGLSDWLVLSVSAFCVLAETEYYESWTGKLMTEKEYFKKESENTSFWCTNVIETCDDAEGRRLDGSCNNLLQPQRGAAHTPTYALLPEVFGPHNTPRLSRSGSKLPLAREVRTSILAEGRVPDRKFTVNVANFLEFVTSDLISGHDTYDYEFWRDCCSNKNDSQCAAQQVPEDDPVHRFSGIRCLNMTRPRTFQSVGCDIDTRVPKIILSESPLFDLSVMYGSSLNDLSAIRLYENGMLQYEEVDGKYWPPNITEVHSKQLSPNISEVYEEVMPLNNTKFDGKQWSLNITRNICTGNKPELNETWCNAGSGTGVNGLIGNVLFSIWFWRSHNHIASQLAELNPCWDDETLFQTAKDINIAVYSQILFYELLPSLIGEDNLNTEGVMEDGFRDIYDETFVPGMSMEFISVMRWFHTIQQGIYKLFEADGSEIGEIPVVNLTFRTGWLLNENRLALLTQGSFRQATAGFDQIVDPDIAEIGYGQFQQAMDLLTLDLAKNRYFGHASYVDYVNLCEGTNVTFTNFDDLADHIEPEMIEVLENIYEDVNDIDLQAGLWCEKKVEGGFVPNTFSCIAKNFLDHVLITDRHWYERPNRPKPFSKDQLAEVKKMTLASFLCITGDSVTEIQPRAFELISDKNSLTRCSDIPTINLTPWTDSSCKN